MSARILTLAEVAERLRCSVSTVKLQIARGNLAAVNLGTASHRHYRVTEQALAEFLEVEREPVVASKPKDTGIARKSFLKLG